MDKNLVRRIAAQQLGLIGLDQLRQIDVSHGSIAHGVRSGFLERAGHRLFRISGSPRSSEQLRLAAVLDAGGDGAISHLAAAHHWKMTRRSAPPEVVRPRGNALDRPTLARVHRVRDLRSSHIVRVECLPVTTPARTVMDLAAVAPLGQVARCLDRAWGQRLLTLGALANVLADVRRQGRRGVRMVEHLIEERLGHRPTESALERRFEEIAKRCGLVLRRQVDIVDGEGWISRVDFVSDSLNVVVLIDGDAWHLALTQQAADDIETQRLRGAGYGVLRVPECQLLFDEAAVVSRIEAIRANALAPAA